MIGKKLLNRILVYMEEQKINRGNFASNVLFLEIIDQIKPGHRILEIGSGKGAILAHLQKEGIDVVGIDINRDYIQFARDNFNVEIFEMSGDCLCFPEQSFDFVISFDAFEHIRDTAKHLSEVKRVLRDGGAYLFETPNKITNIPFEIIKEKSFTRYQDYHCSLFSFWGLKKILKKSSFDVKFVKVPIVNDYFLEKVKRYFGSFGLGFVRILHLDYWPVFSRVNFYLVATKK